MLKAAHSCLRGCDDRFLRAPFDKRGRAGERKLSEHDDFGCAQLRRSVRRQAIVKRGIACLKSGQCAGSDRRMDRDRFAGDLGMVA